MRDSVTIELLLGGQGHLMATNCWHPKGQTRLVIPTPAVLNVCADPLRDGFVEGGAWAVSTSF
jgi:hypothetical protein